MPKPMTVPMTPGISAADNYTIQVTALDPTTGDVVAGVTVSNVAILGPNTMDEGDTSDVKPYATPDKSYFVGDAA